MCVRAHVRARVHCVRACVCVCVCVCVCACVCARARAQARARERKREREREQARERETGFQTYTKQTVFQPFFFNFKRRTEVHMTKNHNQLNRSVQLQPDRMKGAVIREDMKQI